jgi:hypothetical protein
MGPAAGKDGQQDDEASSTTGHHDAASNTVKPAACRSQQHKGSSNKMGCATGWGR